MGNKIISNNLNILALAETHIYNSDTDSLLKFLSPPGFQLIYRPWMSGGGSGGGGVGLLTRKDLPAKAVDAPAYSTFENILI